MKLAIVVGTPLTTEWIWERNQAAKDKRGLDELPYDETDDSYTVIDGPGYEYHDHVPSLYVFAPHYHVPLYLQRRFKGYLEKAEKKQKEEEEKDRIFRQAHDCWTRTFQAYHRLRDVCGTPNQSRPREG